MFFPVSGLLLWFYVIAYLLLIKLNLTFIAISYEYNKKFSSNFNKCTNTLFKANHKPNWRHQPLPVYLVLLVHKELIILVFIKNNKYPTIFKDLLMLQQIIFICLVMPSI